MEKKPIVAEMMEWLHDLVNWEPFAQLLPGMTPAFIEIIKRENRDYIAGQKIALYSKWLAVHPGATWGHVIDVLERTHNTAIAQNVRNMLGIPGPPNLTMPDVLKTI